MLRYIYVTDVKRRQKRWYSSSEVQLERNSDHIIVHWQAKRPCNKKKRKKRKKETVYYKD